MQPYLYPVQPDQRRNYARPTDETIRLARADQHAKRPLTPSYLPAGSV